jgi:AcrR family transcriptional regulator
MACGSPRATARAVQRASVLDAMLMVVGERGFAGASVAAVTARAKVSSRTFYELFDGQRECFLAVIDDQTELAVTLVADAFERAGSWREGLRMALATLLVFLDSEPLVARVWLVEVLGAGSWALERRARNLSRLTRLIVGAWELPRGWEPPPLAAEGVLTSVLGVLHNHVVTGCREPLISLLGPLMGIVTRPYLGSRGVAREVVRGEVLAEEIQGGRAWELPFASSPAVVEIPDVVAHPSAHRARRCLLFVAEHPGVSNRQIATGVGIKHPGQISSLLARLLDVGLLDKRAGARGRPHAWRVTPYGAHTVASLGDR